MTDNTQPEALRLTEIARYCFRSEGMSDPPEQFESPTGDMVDYFDHVAIEKELLARITELESQLAQRFDAADMATASAQGFRDGVASVSAGSELVYQARYQKGFWQDSSRERYEYLQNPENTCAEDWETRILYTHPSPQEGMAGWMPIETAPKDGSRILLHPAVEVADDWSKGHWNSEHECWIVGGSPSGVVHTAWHPLPPAPSTEGESNG